MQCGGKGGETVTVSAGEKLDGSVRLCVHFSGHRDCDNFSVEEKNQCRR